MERADNRSNMYSGPVESRGKSSGRNRTGEWEESRQYRTGESKDSGQDETGEGNGTCQEETDESKAESKASGKSGKAAYIRDLVLKFALFNIMYITALLVYSKLFGLDPLFDGTVFEKFGIAGSRPLVWLILFIMGQIAWLIFDKAYIIIARGFSGKIRRLFRWQ
ncbi:MAG: hypothetical protein VZR00_00175 [Lachnospiraceae bacterium]|nr:hypothetical protein [Lachnospiraceae bacterium]